MHGVVDVIQQMGLDSKFNEATYVVKHLRLDLDIVKDAYSKAESTKRRRKRSPHPVVEAAKIALDNAPKAWNDSEAKTDVIEAQIFQQTFF